MSALNLYYKNAARNPFFRFFNDFDQVVGSDHNLSVPKVNILEFDDRFELELAVPGLNKDAFQVKLDEQVLTISSEQKDEKTDETGKFTRREFSYKSFRRSFRLPKSIDGQAIQANYTDGILRLELPKREEEVRVVKQIEIK